MNIHAPLVLDLVRYHNYYLHNIHIHSTSSIPNILDIIIESLGRANNKIRCSEGYQPSCNFEGHRGGVGGTWGVGSKI